MFSILFFLLVIHSVVCSCPSGSVLSGDGKSCFLPNEMLSDFFSTESVCQLLGGHLASIHSEQENQLVYNAIKTNIPLHASEFYLRLNVDQKTNNWTWTDGSPVDFLKFAEVYAPKPYYIAALIAHATDAQDAAWAIDTSASQYTTFAFVCKIPTCSSSSRPSRLISTANTPKVADTKHLVFNSPENRYYFGHYLDTSTKVFGQKQCANLGGTLPIIKNAFDNSQTVTSAKQILDDSAIAVTLGLSNVNGSFVWDDGTPVRYFNWAPGQPSSNSGTVMLNINTSQWYISQQNGNIVCTIPADVDLCN